MRKTGKNRAGWNRRYLVFAFSDGTSVHCHRLFRKKITMRWDEMSSHGTFYRIISVDDPYAKFRCFRRGPSGYRRAFLQSKRFPRLSEGILFIMARPKAEKAIARFCPKP